MNKLWHVADDRNKKIELHAGLRGIIPMHYEIRKFDTRKDQRRSRHDKAKTRAHLGHIYSINIKYY